MRAKAILAVTAAVSALAVAPSVRAQVIAGQTAVGPNVGTQFKHDRNISVRNRPRPGYETLGIHAGSFFILPKVTATATYDDNIYAKAVNPKDTDLIGALIGEISAGSNWARNSVNLYAKLERDQYKDHPFESRTSYVVGGNGELDVQSDYAITAGGRYTHSVELRTASGAPANVRTPVQFGLTTVNFAEAKAFNRLRLTGTYEMDAYNYSDTVDFAGTPVLQSYRNRVVHLGALRADYAVSPDTFVFVQASGNLRDYEHRPPDPLATLDRNSDGYEVSVGADFELAALLRGQVRAGYLKHQFANPALAGVSGLGARADIEWFPTDLTTVAFYGGREVRDTGLLFSPASISTYAGAQVDHELLRNLILTAKYDYSHDDFRGIFRVDQRHSASAGAVYLLNRRLGINLLYTLLKQTSTGANAGAEYTVNRVSASLVVQY